MAEGLVLKVVDQGVTKYLAEGNVRGGCFGGNKYVDDLNQARVFDLDEAIKLERDIREGFRWPGIGCCAMSAMQVDEQPELIKVEYEARLARPFSFS